MELSICGCKKFVCESFGGNIIVNAHSGGNLIVNAHSGAKKAHGWAVEQLGTGAIGAGPAYCARALGK